MKGVLYFVVATILLLVIAGCSGQSASEENSQTFTSPFEETEPEEKETVGYHNPNTGYETEYNLDVDHNPDGTVDQINFSNGGYIGSHHITGQDDNGDGTVTVYTDRGQEFTVDKEEE
jgi:hypothetical protein